MAVAVKFADRAWQNVYRVGFRLALGWWWLRRPRHEGVLVAIHVGDSILMVQSSYRTAWSLPGGGVHRGEALEAAARRELAEEVGITEVPLSPAGSACGLWDWQRDHVYFFTALLPALPCLRLDHREIIGAQLVPLVAAKAMPVTGSTAAYFASAASRRCSAA